MSYCASLTFMMLDVIGPTDDNIRQSVANIAQYT